MKLKFFAMIALGVIITFNSTQLLGEGTIKDNEEVKNDNDGFVYEADRFADIKVIRYQIPGWDKLSLDQKKLVYYLSQAGYSGRDIIWDQNYRFNLEIRTALETILKITLETKQLPTGRNLLYTQKEFGSRMVYIIIIQMINFFLNLV